MMKLHVSFNQLGDQLSQAHTSELCIGFEDCLLALREVQIQVFTLLFHVFKSRYMQNEQAAKRKKSQLE